MAGWTAVQHGRHWHVMTPGGRIIPGISAMQPGQPARTEAEVIEFAKRLAAKKGWS